MTEPNGTPAGGDPPSSEPARCPWCSSELVGTPERCPVCGAALREGGEAGVDDIPGVTQVDPVLGMRRQLARPNRLVGWLADVDTEPAPTIDLAARAAGPTPGQALEGAGAASIAPPSDEVKREMRRLELEALKAELADRAAEARVAALDAGEASTSDAATPADPASEPAATPSSDAEDTSGG